MNGTADKLGIRHHCLRLEASERKLWRHTPSSEWQSVEEAALDYFETDGWVGHAQERSLILSLIKAASFPEIPPADCSTFVEAIYAQNVWPEERKCNKGLLLANILTADLTRIAANFLTMTSPPARTLAFFPTLTLSKMLGLYVALGNNRLYAIANLFAEDPYTQRSGWPDLTLWRDQEVVFKEVKAPGDEFQGTQARLITTILRPLGYDVE